jgi:membrane-associated phospholipid phosphatase
METVSAVEQGLPDAAVRKLSPVERYGLRVTLFAVALALVGIPFGFLLQQVASDGPLTVLDEDAAAALNRWVFDRPNFVDAMQAISFLGKPIWLFVVIGLPSVWLLVRGERRLVAFLVVTSIGGGLVDTAVKLAVGRPRPEVDEPIAEAFGRSFPSGHSMSATVCYGALLLVFIPILGSDVRRRLAIGAAVVLVLAIGFSRLALGVHFVSDVVGGYVLGLAWLVASVAAFEIWRSERGRRRTRPLEEGVEPEETRDLVSSG